MILLSPRRCCAQTANFGELRHGEVRRILLLGKWINRWEDIRKAEGLTSPSLGAKLRLRASLRPSVVATKEQEMGESAQTQSRWEASCCVVGGGGRGHDGRVSAGPRWG